MTSGIFTRISGILLLNFKLRRHAGTTISYSSESFIHSHFHGYYGDHHFILGAVQRLKKTSSLVWYFQNERLQLKCSFKGWPRPRVVWYNPDSKQITNSTEGFYLSEELQGDDVLRSVLHLHKIQEKHAGVYQCIGENYSSGNWSSQKSGKIALIYQCKSSNSSPLLSPRAKTNQIEVLWV